MFEVNTIINHFKYRNLVKSICFGYKYKFPNNETWKPLITKHVEKMKRQKMNEHAHTTKWEAKEGKICYHEDLGFNPSYGYMTQFKYLKE